MKNTLYISLIIALSFSSVFTFSQGKCTVLKPEIAGSYTGKCKNNLANGFGIAEGTDRYEGQFLKGLPNGKGTYTWAAGESYKGDWKEGRREGVGEYTFYYKGKDSTIYGNWLNDSYIGPIPKKPVVIYKANIDSYSIKKINSIKNRVLINIYQNGRRNQNVTDLMISSSSGHETSVAPSVGYDDVVFPVTIKVTYNSLNKLTSASFLASFEFEIFEPGNWEVNLNN